MRSSMPPTTPQCAQRSAAQDIDHAPADLEDRVACEAAELECLAVQAVVLVVRIQQLHRATERSLQIARDEAAAADGWGSWTWDEARAQESLAAFLQDGVSAVLRAHFARINLARSGLSRGAKRQDPVELRLRREYTLCPFGFGDPE